MSMLSGRHRAFKSKPIQPGPDDREEWRPVPGYDGYEASDWGRVRSYWPKGGRGPRRLKSDPHLVGSQNHTGHYFACLLHAATGERQKIQLAAATLMAFVGPRPDGYQALHRNGDCLDNRLANLYWGTSSQNTIDMIHHGVHPRAVLTADQIPAIWARLVRGDTARDIARDYGVSGGTIDNIKAGDHWAHITQHLPGWPIFPDTYRTREPIYIPAEFCGDDEVWRIISGCSVYRISNFGRAQSRRERYRNGRAVRWRVGETWHDLKLSNSLGYPVFAVVDDAGRQRQMKAHIAVLTAFACSRPEGMVACHGDGNRANSHASNLRWDTPRANNLDRVRHRGR